MDVKSLEPIIRQYVKLGKKNTKGWEGCVHTTCDHGKKGMRAAFLFEGDSTAFHCFNCGTKSGYSPSSSEGMPKVMSSIMDDFGIPQDEWQGILLHSMKLRDAGITPEMKERELAIIPKALSIPKSFYLLDNAAKDDKWAEIARWYLKEDRLLDPEIHPFMLSGPSDDVRLKKWQGRLIIPVMRGNECVYYQGRDLTGKKTKKYESPADPKDRVLFGFEKLYEPRDRPLYVVEGVFDAMLVDGVALMGNELTDAHAAWLTKSPRQKVYIPDRFGNGKDIAEKCLDLGWHVSVPYDNSWDSSLKDITNMMKHYGKMFVMAEIIKHTSTGFAARARLNSYCLQETQKTA